ncbi:UNVERIFIED_ORG: hypothetical protein QFZ59_000089 [Bacillus sp. B2I3]|nr:hypothetical protein [Bacillus sp. B2I3]
MFTNAYTWLYIRCIHICSYCKQFENNSTNIATTYEGLTIVETFSTSRIVERRAVKYFKGVKLCLNMEEL